SSPTWPSRRLLLFSLLWKEERNHHRPGNCHLSLSCREDSDLRMLGLRTGREDNLGDGLAGEFASEFVGRGRDGAEGGGVGVRFVAAEDAVELAQVDGQDGAVHRMPPGEEWGQPQGYRPTACMNSFGGHSGGGAPNEAVSLALGAGRHPPSGS